MDYTLFLVTKISAVPGFTSEGKWSSEDLRLTDSRPVCEILMSCDLFYIPCHSVSRISLGHEKEKGNEVICGRHGEGQWKRSLTRKG